MGPLNGTPGFFHLEGTVVLENLKGTPLMGLSCMGPNECESLEVTPYMEPQVGEPLEGTPKGVSLDGTKWRGFTV